METIRYTQLGKEDIRFGKGTFQEVDIGAILSDSALSSAALNREVGTWTPSVGGNATYTTQEGRYTRIGNVITVSCRMIINVIGTGSSTTITGLPYPTLTETTAVFAIYFQDLVSSKVTVVGQVSEGTSNIRLQSLAAAGITMTIAATMGNDTTIYFCGSYLTEED
jgi:hypothetical protein